MKVQGLLSVIVETQRVAKLKGGKQLEGVARSEGSGFAKRDRRNTKSSKIEGRGNEK